MGSIYASISLVQLVHYEGRRPQLGFQNPSRKTSQYPLCHNWDSKLTENPSRNKSHFLFGTELSAYDTMNQDHGKAGEPASPHIYEVIDYLFRNN
jgi:hypothetical protein